MQQYILTEQSKTINAISNFFKKHKDKKIRQAFKKIFEKDLQSSGNTPISKRYYSFL